MTAVSLLQFRRNAEGVLRRVQRGQSLVLTVRGKPVARLEPIATKPSADDPLYRLGQLAVGNGKSLSNRDMDRLIYET